MLCALEARVRLVSSQGERELPLAALYRDDGIAYLHKQAEEIVAEIRVPAESDASHCRSSFITLRRRGAIDFAVLDVAAAVWLDADGTVRKARMFLGAVASLPTAVEIEPILRGRRLDEDPIRDCAKLARQNATPLDNTDFQAQWRGAMVEAYAARALRALL